MKRTEDSLRDLWDNITCTDIQIIVVTEEEKRKKGYEKIFEGLQLKISPTWKRKQSIKSKRHRVPYRINPRRNTPRHILLKLTKTTPKEKLLKAAREKQQVT